MTRLMTFIFAAGLALLVGCGDDSTSDSGPVDAAGLDTGPTDGAPADVVSPDAADDAAMADSGDDAAAPDSGDDAAVADGGGDAAAPDGGTCIAEGGSRPVVPSAPPCCPGLEPISCTRPVDGVCPSEPCVGATFCAKCGDSTCGPGENLCNCPGDCS